MMQTLNLYSTARTAEIMARYRPIAPKPEVAQAAAPVSPTGDHPSSSALPQSVRNSPYLMNVWPNLQARPTRTRKRGRTALAPPAVKRSRTCLQGLSPPYQVTDSSGKTLAPQVAHDPNGIPQLAYIPNLLPLKCEIDSPVATRATSITLPFFIPCATILTKAPASEDEGLPEGIDLNKSTESPEGLDFMPQLQGAAKSSALVNVIAPLPVRPISSSITVGRITHEYTTGVAGKQLVMKPEEVEKEVESEALPVVVSGSNNKVRLANSAYNEMVGQPECCWLDCMSCGSNRGGGACKRIGGEVVIEFSESGRVASSSKGFTCWVRIEWGNDGKKRVVNAFCDATPLVCDTKDYLFEWRFHIGETSESGSEV